MGSLALGVVPQRVQYAMNRFELTGKVTRKQRAIIDHHFLLQREFEFKAKAEARAAKKAAEDA